MKYLYITLIFLQLYIFANAQNSHQWQNIFLKPTGDNVQDGVAAFYKVDECNGQKVVFLKFINTNNYSVQIEWYDGIFTIDKEWKKFLDADHLKTLNLAPGKEISGECNDSIMSIKISDFVNPEKFKRYGTFYFEVNNIKN